MDNQDKKLMEQILRNLRRKYDIRSFKEHREKQYLYIALVVFAFFCCISFGFIFYLLPLKQTQPIIAVIDSQTGIVSDIEYGENNELPEGKDKLIRSYVYSYIINRYSYSYDGIDSTLREQYRQVSNFSNENVNQVFRSEIDINNENSPINTLGTAGIQKITVNSINIFPGENRFQAQFRVIQIKDKITRVYSYSVIGSYEWNNYSNMNIKDKWQNPFGFKINSWSIQQNYSDDVDLYKKKLEKKKPNINNNIIH